MGNGRPNAGQDWYDGEIGDMCAWKTAKLGKFRSAYLGKDIQAKTHPGRKGTSLSDRTSQDSIVVGSVNA